ncbi:MAG: alpha/beta fold hydrolase [Spirochaetia bacterium]
MSRWVSVGGAQLHFLESGGPRDGSPVLLMVHGWSGSAADWARLLPALPSRMHAIAVDLPGCGLSDKPDAAYDIPWFVESLRAFCEALGVPRIVLAGHSMGGQIAVHLVTRHPGLVEKLILVDPCGLEGQEGGMGLLARLGPVVNLAFHLNCRLFIEWALRTNVLHDPSPDLLKDAVDSTAASILGRDGVRAISRITRRVIGRESVDELLPGIGQETLLIWGECDRLLPPRGAEAFAARLRHASVHRIDGVGHMPMLESPEAVAALITDFVERQGPSPRTRGSRRHSPRSLDRCPP